MADAATLSHEERIGIGAAIAAHVLLVIVLTVRLGFEPIPLAPPERIDVSLATEVSLESTAPDPSSEPAAALAPEIGEVSEQPVEVVETPVERPVERPVTQPPRRTRDTPRPAPTPTATQTQAPRGSRLDPDFVSGTSNSTGDRGSPAATFGPAERAALASAITRQLRPHWSAPSGVEVEELVSVVSWELNQDGTLKGTPRCRSQRGITDSNRPQASLHCERAIRAVQLAAPFNLPEQFYSRWDDLEWEFDRRL